MAKRLPKSIHRGINTFSPATLFNYLNIAEGKKDIVPFPRLKINYVQLQ
jgi:hypothetical protein